MNCTHRFLLLILASISILAVSSCESDDAFTPQGSIQTETPQATCTTTPTVTVTPTHVYVCPSIDPSLSISLPTAYSEYLESYRAYLADIEHNPFPELPEGFDLFQSYEAVEASVHAYLNLGGDPGLVAAALVEAEYEDDFQIELVDLTGDEVSEVVFIGMIHASDGAASDLWIYQCIDSEYEIQVTDRLGFNVQVTAFDLLGNGYPQLILQYGTMSMGWNEGHSVFGWDGETWGEFYGGGTNWPGYLIPVDMDGDGVYELATYGLVCRSITCAERYVLEYYKWDGTTYQPLYEEEPPSLYRVHYLFEGERYLQTGDYAQAIIYYQFARKDHLKTELTFTETSLDQTDMAEAYQISFAYFRESMIWMLLNRVDVVEIKLNYLEEDFHVGDPGYEFVWALRYAFDNYRQGVGLDEICEGITAELTAEYPEVIYHIGGWGWGRDDLDYTIAELCPFPLERGDN